MKVVKEFICDGDLPSDEEILKSIEIANKENCIIKLQWFGSYSGWHKIQFNNGATLEKIKEILKKHY